MKSLMNNSTSSSTRGFMPCHNIKFGLQPYKCNLFVPWNNFLLLCEQHSSIESCSSKSSHFEETPSDLKEFT